jgi:LmbE family N-acetylglucosaminyl deacetylase
MKPKAHRLLVAAHPDDESIFFGGLLQSRRDLPWHVLCLTDGNADGRGAERALEFQAATKLLGVRHAEQWGYRDIFATRLPVDEIATRLRALPPPKEVYTHGPLGEYGHAHHQDCCLAVHRAFPGLKIFSPAWNCNADFSVKLTPAQFRKKAHAYSKIYAKETSRFLNILPCMPTEGFRRFSAEEVEALTGYLRGERDLDPKSFPGHEWAAEMLPGLKSRIAERLF